MTSLSSDLKLLTYTHVDGSHEPVSLSQYSGALEALASLHKLGFVHGDVRFENIVFYGETSVIIDYDLVRTEKSSYPQSYNWSDIDCRHHDAYPGSPMRIHHDIYSLL